MGRLSRPYAKGAYKVNRQEVVSSNVASVGYNSHSRILEVEFKSGGVYQYLNVPPELHEALMGNVSKGGFMNEYIKGRYNSVKLEPVEAGAADGAERRFSQHQELYLELISLTSHNNMDGERVAASLREHPDLWRAVVMTSSFGLGMTLRDLPGGFHNVDTLFVYTESGIQCAELVKLAYEEWSADHIEIQTRATEGEPLCGANVNACLGGDGVVLAIWWD